MLQQEHALLKNVYLAVILNKQKTAYYSKPIGASTLIRYPSVQPAEASSVINSQ